jgi:hypothetical protein
MSPIAPKVFTIALAANLLGIGFTTHQAFAQVGEYCQFESAAIANKESLRLATFQDSKNLGALKEYQTITKQHSQALNTCRQKSWLKTQGIWLRLYPCDLQSGKLDEVMDRIVNKGYNQVFIEVISEGKILLPKSENLTAWESLVDSDQYKNADLLKLAIAKGRERGLKVHAWMFTMNVGTAYAQGLDRNGFPKLTVARQNAIARNGNGDNTISIVENLGKNSAGEVSTTNQLFIDPYNYQAQSDLYLAVNEVVKRKPDGVVFDYVRYKRGAGAASVVSNVRYLWIYGVASLQALRNRAENFQGRELINRFLRQGYVTPTDLKAIKKLYPQETEPLWQGLQPFNQDNQANQKDVAIAYWQSELWRLAVGHAFIGVTYYLDTVAKPVFREGISASIAFFSDGNQPVGDGFDSRMQPWHLFTSAYGWQPMAYAVCGKPDCIVAQVRRVAQYAPSGTNISPILVGQWNEPYANRPSLEVQMQAIHAAVPTINSISHFAFGWQSQEVAFSRSRQMCKL